MTTCGQSAPLILKKILLSIRQIFFLTFRQKSYPQHKNCVCELGSNIIPFNYYYSVCYSIELKYPNKEQWRIIKHILSLVFLNYLLWLTRGFDRCWWSYGGSWNGECLLLVRSHVYDCCADKSCFVVSF